jgi:DNA-binding IclR family transcriptional regulator
MVIQLGGAYPLHAGASSKALLASLPPEEIQTFFATQRLDPVTDRTITDPDALAGELELIRARGYAVSSGERQAGAASVAAPVLGRGGHLLAVISVCGPQDRFEPLTGRYAEMLLAAIVELSATIGHRRDR